MIPQLNDYCVFEVNSKKYRVKIYSISEDKLKIKTLDITNGNVYIFEKNKEGIYCLLMSVFEVETPTEEDKKKEKASYWLNY